MVASLFLENLNYLMDQRNLSQTKLGLEIGVPQQTISNWFRKKRLPDDRHIDLLAEFFKVEPHYFFMKPGSQGEIKPLDDSNDFGNLLDDLSEKLEPLIQAEWKRMGSKREFVKILRNNFEEDLPAGPNWFLEMRRELLKYVAIDPVQKANDRLKKAQAERAQRIKQSSGDE